jgi:hypothetical protein
MNEQTGSQPVFKNRSILERYFSGSGSPVISASKIEGDF